MRGPLPQRRHLERAADAAGVPHAGLPDLALLEALLAADAYPHLYLLPSDARAPYASHVPGWLRVGVSCAECAARGEIDSSSLCYIETSRLPDGWASVRCPACASVLWVPLRGLPVWQWRWYEEAQSAHETRRLGTLEAPAPSYWNPVLWGEPIPYAAPPLPAPLPSRVMERAVSPRLHQPVTYYLTSGALLGFLAEGPADADGRREVSVDLPTDPDERRASLLEILSLHGRPEDEVDRHLPRKALRLRAAQGLETGCYWPRASQPETMADLAIVEGLDLLREGEE